MFEAFNKDTNPYPNLNDLDNDFEYLFPTFLLPVYDIDWELVADIDKSQQQKNIPSDSISIPNDPSAELTIQDIIRANSARAAELSFNTLFDIEIIANFYTMGSNSFLTYYYSEKCKNSSIEVNKSVIK